MSQDLAVVKDVGEKLHRETYANMTELGFSLKAMLGDEEDEFRLSPVLREISNQIDKHIGLWGAPYCFTIMPDAKGKYSIVCWKGTDEIFSVPVSFLK